MAKNGKAPATAASIIDQHGGPAEFARELGYEGTNGMRRVSMWKRTGIPRLAWPHVVLMTAKGKHPVTYKMLEQQVSKFTPYSYPAYAGT